MVVDDHGGDRRHQPQRDQVEGADELGGEPEAARPGDGVAERDGPAVLDEDHRGDGKPGVNRVLRRDGREEILGPTASVEIEAGVEHSRDSGARLWTLPWALAAGIVPRLEALYA